MNERELFIAALPIEDLAERAAYLDKACGGDAECRQRVEALLAAFAQAGSFLQQPAADAVATSDVPPAEPSLHNAPAEAQGTVIGPYKLLQQIGEGGMGTVFLAEQTHPVQRKVALKLIKSGMDSRQVIARFEAERQALALMDHPNIARVLDAGTTAGGQPYFVMELVKGVPITRYCDEHHLTPRQRLELFVPVCQAVQHAHQKGIIHRDLKPSNVLVCLYDDKPVPKVIDFGIAKAAGARLTEKTLFTELGQVVGTLEYMSPEQAELNQLDIDTRSDIYSLGVLLYELLTGTTPLERKRFKVVAFLEVLRLIREEESPRPSTRLSTTEGLPSIAANRGLEPKKLSGLLRGELDWIVLKALEKDRNRRYETANGLALDAQRYLADEAVQACPPSATYRFKKFLRRNKGPVLAAALVLLVLVGGIIGTTLGLVQAQASAGKAQDEAWKAGQERDQANAARASERKAKDAEIAQRKLAEAARDRAAATLDAMTSADARETLAQQKVITPEQKQFLTSALQYYRELMKETASDETARNRLAGAALRIGRMESRLGRKQEAQAMYLQARDLYARLADDFRNEPAYREGVAISHVNRAHVLAQGIDLEPSEFVGRSDGNSNFVESALGKPEEVAKELRLAIPILQELADNHPKVPGYRADLATTRANLGMLLIRFQKWDKVEEELAGAFKIRARLVADFPEDPQYLYNLGQSHQHLGILLSSSKKRDMARKEHYEAHKLFMRLVSRFSTNSEYRESLAGNHKYLGKLLRFDGKPDQAEKEYHAAIAIYEKLVVEFPGVPRYVHALASGHRNLGNTLNEMRKRDEAVAALKESIRLDPENVYGHLNLGAILLEGKGDYAGAAAAYREVIRLAPKFAEAHMNLGNALLALGKVGEAIVAWEQANRLKPDVASNSLAWMRATSEEPRFRDPEQAVRLAKRVVKSNPEDGAAWNTLGIGHYRTRDWKPAIEALTKSMALRNGGDSFDWFFLAMAHAQLGNKAEARKHYDQAIEWMEKYQPQNPELRRFRAEAAQVLKLEHSPKSDK